MAVEPFDLVSVFLRAAAFITSLQAAGLAWFAATCRRAGVPAVASMNGLLRFSALVAMVLVMTQRGTDAGRLAGEWSGILDAHLQGMVWSRRPGLSSAVCAAGLLAVALSAGKPRRWGEYLGSAGAVAVVGSFALTGHTTDATHAGWARALLAFHVGIVAYWIGAVAGLYRLTRCCDSRAVERAAARFSRAAVCVVPLILPVGITLIWSLLPDLAALRTVYGGFLLAKFLGFCVLIVLAAVNRLYRLPALAAGSPVAIRAFRRVLVAEYGVLASVLAATATMTSLFSWH
jgi:putative copper export protein